MISLPTSDLIRIQLRDDEGRKYRQKYVDNENTTRMREQVAFINDVLAKGYQMRM